MAKVWVVLVVLVACLAPVCASGCVAIERLAGQYRKDNYLPYSWYPEYNQPDPTQGGRVHVVGTAAGLARIASVTVNGQEALQLPAGGSPNFTYFDWARFYHNTTSGRFWLSFHSRNTAWLDTAGTSLVIQAKDVDGKCATGAYEPRVVPTYFTWATPTASPSDWIVHMQHNASTAATPAAITSLMFDGMNVTTQPALPLTLQPGDHAVLRVQLSGAKTRGQVFTMTATVTSGAGTFTIGNGGRTPEPRFPFVSYPQSHDCSFPGMNQQTWSSLTSHHIDTVLMFSGDAEHTCGHQLTQLLNTLGANTTTGPPPGYAFIDTKAASQQPSLTAAARRLVSAVYVTGEDDGKLNSALRTTAAEVQAITDANPSFLTFQGGKTNRHDGAYAGIADIQGLDIYIGACAPVIIEAIAPLPVLATFAYYRNTRNNQMPLPSMTYAQLYSGAWSYQASGVEIAFQIAAVAAAGQKGMLFFQTSFQLSQQNQKPWDGIILRALATFANPTVRQVMQRGDVNGMPFVDSDGGQPFYKAPSVTSVIRSDDYILVIVLNAGATGYSSLTCHIGLGTHWTWPAHTVQSITLTATPDMDLTPTNAAQAKEVVAGSLLPLQSGASISLSGTQLTLRDVAFAAQTTPYRVFLIPYATAK